MENCCVICKQPLQYLHCRTASGAVCLECGQREFLAWLRSRPFELRPSACWDHEKQERQLSKVYGEAA